MLKICFDILGSCEFHVLTGRVISGLAVSLGVTWCGLVRLEYKVYVWYVRGSLISHHDLGILCAYADRWFKGASVAFLMRVYLQSIFNC